MRKHTWDISTLSVLYVLCAGLTTNATAATVRSLGGAGTYDGTAAASTSTRTAPARAGSLRIAPASARLVTATPADTSSSSSTDASSTRNSTGQRLSIGKYLGSAVTTATTTGANTPVSAGTVLTLEEIVNTIKGNVESLSDDVDTLNDTVLDANNGLNARVQELEGKVIPVIPTAEQDADALIKIDVNNEVYIDIDILKSQLIANGMATSPNMVFDYDADTHVLSWTDGEHSGKVLDVDDFASVTTVNELSDALDTLELTVAGHTTTLAGKADKATTLAGYGITDAYTKAQVDAAILSGVSGVDLDPYNEHIANDDIHVTAEQKAAWSAKQNALNADQLAAVNSGIDLAKVTQIATNTTNIAANAAAIETKASQSALNTLSGRVDTAEGKITTLQSDVSALSGDGIGSVSEQIDAKIDTYAETVNEALDAKANSADLATVATSGSYADLSNKPTIPTVPTVVSAFTNDVPYAEQSALDTLSDTVSGHTTALASHETAIAGKASQSALDTLSNTVSGHTTALADKADKATTLAGYGITDAYTKSEVNSAIATGVEEGVDLSDYVTSSTLTNALADYTPTSSLKAVATSGSYNDLSNKPTIDTELSSSSTNAVQNKVVTTALAGKADTGDIPELGDLADTKTVISGTPTPGVYVLGVVDGTQQMIRVVPDSAGKYDDE